MKTLTLAIAGMSTLMGFAGAASADSNGAAMNSCKPHDWIRFGEAVETMDYDVLAEMAREPELRACAFIETAELLMCEINPLACIEPAAPPPPPPPVIDRMEADPLPPPGAHIGVENDRSEPSSSGGSAGGGSDPNGGRR